MHVRWDGDIQGELGLPDGAVVRVRGMNFVVCRREKLERIPLPGLHKTFRELGLEISIEYESFMKGLARVRRAAI